MAVCMVTYLNSKVWFISTRLSYQWLQQNSQSDYRDDINNSWHHLVVQKLRHITMVNNNCYMTCCQLHTHTHYKQGHRQVGGEGNLPWAPPGPLLHHQKRSKYSNRTVTLIRQSSRYSVDDYTGINC